MSDTNLLVDHLFRERAGQMVAWLTRVFGPQHLDMVEEVVQDALLKALQQWPYSGIPSNPGGWLFQVARNRAVDVLRRDTSFLTRAPEITAELVRSVDLIAQSERSIHEATSDDELRMIFLCCHPALPMDARVALSLKTVGGFSVQEIGRAFLVSDATIAQRLVRAKRRLRELDVRFEMPEGVDLVSRLEAVLEVIYLLFNEGYAAREGDELVRIDLCREALRLVQLVARDPATGTPAAHALASLIAFQSARLPARVDEHGELVLLEHQDRSLWDKALLTIGFAHLERSAEGPTMTAYHAQAAIAAAHAGAPSANEIPWPLILRLYDDLVAVNPSPLVRLNRLVALWKVKGLGPALEALGPLQDDPALQGYYLLPAVEGRLLAASGDVAGASRTFAAALALPCTEPERRLLRRLQEATGILATRTASSGKRRTPSAHLAAPGAARENTPPVPGTPG